MNFIPSRLSKAANSAPLWEDWYIQSLEGQLLTSGERGKSRMYFLIVRIDKDGWDSAGNGPALRFHMLAPDGSIWSLDFSVYANWMLHQDGSAPDVRRQMWKLA